MAVHDTVLRIFCVQCVVLICINVHEVKAVSPVADDRECVIPEHFRGEWFSMERGDEVITLMNDKRFENKFFEGQCMERWDDNSTMDALGNHDSKILFYGSASNCYKCYYFFHQTLNIVQYKQSTCRSGSPPPSLEDVCSEIVEFTDLLTFFQTTLSIINCKNTFEGVFHFTYEWDVGGGGICDSEYSQIVACQEPGSPYVDNQVFTMNFGRCPDVQTSTNNLIRFQCMGTWEDDYGNIWSAMADLGEEVYRDRFRCMLTRNDQEEGDNKKRYTMSWWADCSQLKSPYEGPLRLLMVPVVGDYQLTYAKPECNFPTNFSGHWYHVSEFDVDVDINITHMYFKTKLDQFNYKETYFICKMTSGTRYLTVAITVGKCEIDYVCYDMLPRHHSIVRWRMGKPYRLGQVEMAHPDYKLFIFRQACTWSSFTIDREDFAWNYKTFVLNPPMPIPCPIRGRYYFIQEGPESELYRTRYRGVTERPRHMINCKQLVTEWKACDENPSRISIDAEYCETVDHTGRPIGEYDESDWEMQCVGHWEEDWNFYMITYDPEDATSQFRCWNYERTDWRHILMSRSPNAACRPEQTPRTSDPAKGGSLALRMEESERLFDDCSQMYMESNRAWWGRQSDVVDFNAIEGASIAHQSTILVLCLTCLVLIWTQ